MPCRSFTNKFNSPNAWNLRNYKFAVDKVLNTKYWLLQTLTYFVRHRTLGNLHLVMQFPRLEFQRILMIFLLIYTNGRNPGNYLARIQHSYV